MSDVDEPRFNSLADRIKALDQQKNFSSSTSSTPLNPHALVIGKTRRPPPPPPPTTHCQNAAAPAVSVASPAPPLPPPRPKGPPALPARTASSNTTPKRAPPPLPQRAPSLQQLPSSLGKTLLPPPPRPSASTRRASSSSERSQGSQHSLATSVSVDSTSGTHTRKLPPAFDPAALPALPPSRRDGTAGASTLGGPAVPALPPSLPPRRPQPVSSSSSSSTTTSSVSSTATSSTTATTPLPAVSTPPKLPSRPKVSPVPASDAPPPIPLASKPTHANINAVKKRLDESASVSATSNCLYCRDFSAPDLVASQYPRQSVPHDDLIGFLAHVLCDPFPSATDKARAIFTWHHHNIDYDWAGFSCGNVRPVHRVEDVIFSGSAVCAGYAALYEAIARRAGLQCITVAGHGKGIGYTDVPADAPLPAEDASGHAWNAVLIDNGHWKLIDACWGAGTCSASTGYTRHFGAHEFTAPNDVFGLKHFPRDPAHFFRSDGRALSWAEYLRGPHGGGAPPTLCGRFADDGLAPLSVRPAARDIHVADGSVPVRLQVSRTCAHKLARDPAQRHLAALLVRVRGEWTAMNTDGFWWWLDVQAGDLGAAGETIMLAVPNNVDGQAVSGLTVEEYKKGFRSIGFDGLVLWSAFRSPRQRISHFVLSPPVRPAVAHHVSHRRFSHGRRHLLDHPLDCPVPSERAVLSAISIASLAVLLAALRQDASEPLVASAALSVLAFALCYSMIRWLGPTFMRAGFRGRDLCKAAPRGDIPECMGAVCAIVYLLAVIVFIPLPFYKDIVAATSGGGNKDVVLHVDHVQQGRLLHKFPHNKLASYLSAIISLQCIALLGIGDDLFDIRWRHKWWIPGLASIPILTVYFVDFGVTSIVIPIPLQPYLGDLFDLGLLYYVYMACVAMFCPQSINMLAGINGIEVSQCVVVALLLAINDALYLLTPYPHPAVESHLFSLYLLLPWIGVSLALLCHNWYPARVFVGDTYCYFSGMVFAVVGILGHFSKTLGLLLMPQLFNFAFSTPQVFGLVPCPRHRLPRFNPTSGLLEPSLTPWTPDKQPLPVVAYAFRLLAKLRFVSVREDDHGRFVETSNLTLLNLWLVLRGPMREDRLALEVTMLQLVVGLFGLFVRHKLALLVFQADNWSILT